MYHERHWSQAKKKTIMPLTVLGMCTNIPSAEVNTLTRAEGTPNSDEVADPVKLDSARSLKHSKRCDDRIKP